jgi:hypothetical protein
MRIQAAYNNLSESDLQSNDIGTVDEAASSLYPIGTKVAKQFDGVDGELVWFEGVVQRYIEEDDLYWMLYIDGDAEDMNEPEVRDAVHDYRVHLQHDVVVAEAQIDTCDSILPNISVDVNDMPPSLDIGDQVSDTALKVADSMVLPSSGSSSSDIVVAMQAMTAAAERLTTASARIEAAAQTQHIQHPQPQQQH